MNRINQLFEQKKSNILSLYFCAGYPDADNTPQVIESLEKEGIDMIEIGIPFSDPMADGPVIQNAATKALRNGMSLRRLFSQLTDVRKSVNIPLILMGYLNPVMQYGFEAFFSKCAEIGIDGCIIPDLPFDDYMADIKPLSEKYGVQVIMLITPETTDERIRFIDEHTSGFIYMVSSASITGAQNSFDAQNAYFTRVNSMNLRNPRMIGFGISNKATLEAANAHANGAIIGSKFVTLQGETSSAGEAVTKLREALEK